MLGSLLALLSAVTFSWNAAAMRRGVITGSPMQAMAITVPIGVPLILGAALAVGQPLFIFSPVTLGYLSIAGVVHFIFGRYFHFRAITAIGTNLVTPVQQFSLVITLSMAIAIVGEVLTVLRIIGIVLVVLGPAFTLRPVPAAKAQPVADEVPLERKTARPPPFQPRYLEGYVFAVLSAIAYGITPILLRLSLEDRGIGASLAAGLVTYASATLVMLVILALPGKLREVRAQPRESAKWFVLSGVLVCASQMFFYMAMAVAPLTVVAPIQRMALVFRLYFSRLLTPDHEVFGGGMIWGTIVSVLGAAALTVSTDMVMDLLQWPDWVAALLRWHWP